MTREYSSDGILEHGHLVVYWHHLERILGDLMHECLRRGIKDGAPAMAIAKAYVELIRADIQNNPR